MWSSSSSATAWAAAGAAEESGGLPAVGSFVGLAGLPLGGLLAPPRGFGPGEDGLGPGESSSFRAPAGDDRLGVGAARGLGDSVRRGLGDAARFGSGIAPLLAKVPFAPATLAMFGGEGAQRGQNGIQTYLPGCNFS